MPQRDELFIFYETGPFKGKHDIFWAKITGKCYALFRVNDWKCNMIS